MENASDAIIMAGAMLIFVIALTVAMTVFSQARATIDTVLYASDITNYYEYFDTTNNNVKNRRVGLETVIPTLYKYYKENYTVVFLDKIGNGIPLYQSQTNALLWSGNDTGLQGNIPPIASKYPGMSSERKKTDNRICSFDVEEETKRHEPWTGTTEDYKNNIDKFLNGGIFIYPDGSGKQYNYKELYGQSFVERYKGSQFIETIGEYNTKEKSGFAAELNQGIRDNKSKRVIVYQLAN